MRNTKYPISWEGGLKGAALAAASNAVAGSCLRDVNTEPSTPNSAPALPPSRGALCLQEQLSTPAFPHYQGFLAWVPAPLTVAHHHGHNCKLKYLCLKPCKLTNCICHMAFTPHRSPVAFSTLILIPAACLDWEEWREIMGDVHVTRYLLGVFWRSTWVRIPKGNPTGNASSAIRVSVFLSHNIYKANQDSLTLPWARKDEEVSRVRSIHVESSARAANMMEGLSFAQPVEISSHSHSFNMWSS